MYNNIVRSHFVNPLNQLCFLMATALTYGLVGLVGRAVRSSEFAARFN